MIRREGGKGEGKEIELEGVGGLGKGERGGDETEIGIE